jgi:tetratricopeptide (TPR) repeat protein
LAAREEKSRSVDPGGDGRAILLFGKALEINRDYARGFAGLAEATYSRAFFVPLPKPFEHLVNEALIFAERSVALDDSDARPHSVLGWACMFRREFDRARRHFDLSESLNPNDADLMMHRAGALALLGEVDAAIELARKAIRLNPHHAGWYLDYVSLIYFAARRYEAVLATARTGRDAYPSSPAWRAAASAYLGRYEEARRHADDLIARLQGRWEGAATASLNDHAEYLCGVIPFKRAEDAEHLLEGLREADRHA